MTRTELISLIRERKSFLCVGLDTDPAKMPAHLRDAQDGIFLFNRAIIDATIDHCVAYKPNLAFYEALGIDGLRQLKLTMDYLHQLGKPVFTIVNRPPTEASASFTVGSAPVRPIRAAVASESRDALFRGVPASEGSSARSRM